MTDVIGYVGENLDINVRHGADQHLLNVTLLDSDGNPVSLAGAAFSGSIYRNAESLALLAITAIDEAAGTFSIGVTHTESAKLVQPKDLMLNKLHDWGCDITLSNGDRIPLYYGQAFVYREPA